MSYQNIKNFRNRLKERAVYVMGGKCQCCGYDKCITALEFHHLDPKEKDFNFGSNSNRSWQNTRDEIQKCILVCANCHREIHFGLIDNNSLKSSFSEEKAQEIDKLVEMVKTKKVSYCKFCGKEVWPGNDCCPSCASINQRKVERPSREELKNKIRDLSFLKIGSEYGVSDNTIRKWCIAYNLPSKKKDIKQYSDIDWKQL